MADVAVLVAKCDAGDGLSSVHVIYDDLTLQILRFDARSIDSERSLNLRVKATALEREVEVEKQAQRTINLSGDALFMVEEFDPDFGFDVIRLPDDMGITATWPDPRA